MTPEATTARGDGSAKYQAAAQRAPRSRGRDAIPTQIDQPARKGAKRISARTCGPRPGRRDSRVAGEETGHKTGSRRRKDKQSATAGENDTERLAEEQFLAANRGGQAVAPACPVRRSPTTEYAARTAGTSGRISSSRNVAPTDLSTAAAGHRAPGAEDDDDGLDEKDQR